MTPDDLRSAVVDAAREMLRLGLVPGTSGNAMDGEPAEGQRERSSERRVHLAIRAARPEFGAVAAAAGGPVLTARHAPTGADEIAAVAVEALETPAAALATCVAVERQAQIAWLVRR